MCLGYRGLPSYRGAENIQHYLPKHGKDDDFDGQELPDGMKRVEQLPGSPVEIDERVESAGLRDAIGDTEVHPSIVGPDSTSGIDLAQLGDPETGNTTQSYRSITKVTPLSIFKSQAHFVIFRD